MASTDKKVNTEFDKNGELANALLEIEEDQ